MRTEDDSVTAEAFTDSEIKSYVWSQTPLGAIATWSDDLKTAVPRRLTELERAEPATKTARESDLPENWTASDLLQATQANAFRVRLMDALRPLRDATEIQAIAARILGEALGATRVIYIEVVSDGEEVIVNCNQLAMKAAIAEIYSLLLRLWEIEPHNFS